MGFSVCEIQVDAPLSPCGARRVCRAERVPKAGEGKAGADNFSSLENVSSDVLLQVSTHSIRHRDETVAGSGNPSPGLSATLSALHTLRAPQGERDAT